MTLRPLFFALFAAACTGPEKDQADTDTGTTGSDTGTTNAPEDADSDGFTSDVDCDDTNAAINPDADEICDGLDNNCDGVADDESADDAHTWYADHDHDGVGDANSILTSCNDLQGYVLVDGDCDDEDAANFPGNPEVCDGADNDCDGDADEDATDAATWYSDLDGDGHGDADNYAAGCTAPPGFVADATDCDDDDASVYTGAAEACDGADNDCDGDVDEDGSSLWYADADGDGYGDPAVNLLSCDAPPGYVADATDCNDGSPEVYPGAPERCDLFDNDCDGVADDDATDMGTWYADRDGDGYGDATVVSVSCTAPAGSVADATDCDDASATVHPGAADTCDSVDDDCDGFIDEDGTRWYADDDGDGYGDASRSVVSCTAPSGYVADDTDCDDTDASVTTCGGVVFDGTFGTAWETLASGPAGSYSLWGLQSFHPSGTLLYNLYPDIGQAYDPDTDSWSYLSTSAPTYRNWNQMAPWDGDLYGIFQGGIYEYAPATDTWTNLGSYTGSDDYNMTESDVDGNIYGYTGDGNIVVYHTSDGSVDYVATGLGSQYETRMGYDPTTNAIYFGSFGGSNLYKYDLGDRSVSSVASIPESQLNDIFCSDRSGHIYAAGDTYGTTIWQYTTATDTWAEITDLPADHGNNSTCTVSEDGWLYVSNDDGNFYRLALY